MRNGSRCSATEPTTRPSASTITSISSGAVSAIPYWSISAYLKSRVKNAVEFVGNYADAIVAEARKHGVDGVVCGHIHHAEIREIDGVLYCNDGDWVESCTALVEHSDGRLEILYWAALRDLDPLAAPSREPEQERDLAAADAS